MKRKGKILLSVLVIVMLALAFTIAGTYSMFKSEIAAVKSIAVIEDDTYHMTFRGAYGFDEFLEGGGASSDAMVASYLTGFLSKGFYKSKVETEDGGCSVISDGKRTGRNFDWEDAPVMVVSAYPDEGYASVSTFDVLPQASLWESGHGNDGCIPKDVLHRLWPARPVRPRLMVQASFACSIRFMIRFASARMFTAAFTSLSCVTPHSGHVHSRTLRSLVPCHTCPHAEQVWDDGQYRPILMTLVPYFRAHHSRISTNSENA